MNKGLSVALIVLFGAACLLFTGLMPLAELGWLNANTQPGPPQSLEPIRAAVAGFAGELQKDANFQYYIYALFLGLAMTAAAIAINVIGREDAEEKTVLPLKK
jgi:hypothetical protein